MNKVTLKNIISSFIKQKSLEEENLFDKDIFLKTVYETISSIEDNHSDIMICDYEHEASNMKVDAFELISDDTLKLYYVDYSVVEESLSSKSIEDYVIKITNFVDKSNDDLIKYLDPVTDIYSLVKFINNNYSKLKNIQINIVTNKEYNGVKEYKNEINDKDYLIKIYDLDIIDEYNVFTPEDSERISVNLKDDFDITISSIRVDEQYDKFDVYMFFAPAYVLAKVYEKYGYDFLSGNVRAYLKKTQKVNKGILETIKNEPNYFVAYNNGLSTVASGIDVDANGNISKINDWQVVNGGQTTATTYEALKENIDLSKVYIPVKLTILNGSENISLIEKISEYANTQSKVNSSDFASNEEFHIEIEKQSRRVCVPQVEGQYEFTKWYYERIKSQYDLAKSRNFSGGFIKEFPKKNKFDKKELGKVVMSWELEPHTVSLGGEKCFDRFNLLVKEYYNLLHIDEVYYKKIISLIIIYKSIDKIVDSLNFGGYKNNINTYVMSKLAYDCEQKLDLIKIWKNQSISFSLSKAIETIAKDVFEKMTHPPKNNINVAMWARRAECWDGIRNLNIDYNIEDDLSSEKNIFIPKETSTINFDDLVIEETDFKIWFDISQWGKDTELIPSNYRSMAYTVGQCLKMKRALSDKQKEFAKEVYVRSFESGFKLKED